MSGRPGSSAGDGSGGYSLFPNSSSTPKPQAQQIHPRRQQPRASPSPSSEISPQWNGRATPQQQSNGRQTPLTGGRQTPQAGRRTPQTYASNEFVIDGRQSAGGHRYHQSSPISPESPDDGREEIFIAGPAASPVAAADAPARTGTAFSDAQTLVRAASVKSRSSIAKEPLDDDDHPPMPGSSRREPPVPIRSIFPQYNPNLPLTQQEYFPTQTSPARIPPHVINKIPYSPTAGEDAAHQNHEHQALPSTSHFASTISAAQRSQIAAVVASSNPVITPGQSLSAARIVLRHQQETQQPQAGSEPDEESQQQYQSEPQMQAQAQPQTQQPHHSSAPSVAGSQRGYVIQHHTQQAAGSASVYAGSVAGGVAGGARWASGRPLYEAPPIPETSTGDEVRSLWKVANGWKASGAEGRVFCLRMQAERDTPVYTLSSAHQAFYHLRIDPTSVSAYVTLSRHDPSKQCKGPPPPPINSSSELEPDSSSHRGPSLFGRRDGTSAAAAAAAKNWTEALCTTLEAPDRRLPPGDGLVALLYPTAAAKMALERPDDELVVATAERECARLVWDADTSHYFLVHPALATPFCVTTERAPAWSRTEYTLEHVESPHHLAKLTTKDGQGEGWLEVDTSIAAKIDCFFTIDVVVAALMLVAHQDERNRQIETFEPPPARPAAAARRSGSIIGRAVSGDRDEEYGGYPGDDMDSDGGNGRRSKLSKVKAKREAKRERERRKKEAKKNKSKRGTGSTVVEEFELDLESQNSSLRKMAKAERKRDAGDDDSLHLPGGLCVKIIFKTIAFFFKAFIWTLTIIFRTFGCCVRGCLRCCGEKPPS